MNRILNHFGAVEVLLNRRRELLADFDGCAPNDAILVTTNRLFHKATIEEMRGIVDAYDHKFKREENTNDSRT